MGRKSLKITRLLPGFITQTSPIATGRYWVYMVRAHQNSFVHRQPRFYASSLRWKSYFLREETKYVLNYTFERIREKKWLALCIFFSGHLETGLVSFRFLSTIRTPKRLRNGSKGEQIVNDTTTKKTSWVIFIWNLFKKRNSERILFILIHSLKTFKFQRARVGTPSAFSLGAKDKFRKNRNSAANRQLST